MQTLALANAEVSATICSATGRLVALRRPGGENLLRDFGCHYYLREQNVYVTQLADPGAGHDTGRRAFETVAVTVGDTSVAASWASGELDIEMTYSVAPGQPLLLLRCRITRTGGEETPRQEGLPRFVFADGFADPFEDERDLYCDGEELGDGRELPCWRVFPRQTDDAGLLLATRSKLEMSHLNVLPFGFELRPDRMWAYDTSAPITDQGLTLAVGASAETTFELGPWQQATHAQLLAAARLTAPTAVAAAPVAGEPPKALTGVVFRGADFAPEDAVSTSFTDDRWLLAALPACQQGQALFCGAGVVPPPLELDPQLQGVHRIMVGIGNGDGLQLQLDSDALTTFRVPSTNDSISPFRLRLSGPQPAREITFKTAEMTGRKLLLARLPNRNKRCAIDYVRFEPLTEEAAAAWRSRESGRPTTVLAGFVDTPDIARFTDARDPDPAAYRVNLWEHANCGIRRVYWRIDGQCSDFPCAVNTMRYSCARVHGIFNPSAKGYGRVLQRTDMLQLAVAAAAEFGLELYGWMRFNSYMGNVQSDFYKDHPELREEYESGWPAKKLCLAHATVRQHKIAILIEAARYGLTGLNLGFLRHPPVLEYAPVLCAGYEAEFGRPPPRDRENRDSNWRRGLPPDDDRYRQWHAYRARYLTGFGRELRAALAEAGLAQVKVAIWVRPTHCLFDGIDIEAWLDEGLCDEVVATDYISSDVSGIDPAWKARVQGRVPLLRGINGSDIDNARSAAPQIIADGYDGICTYESNDAVLNSEWAEFYRELRS